MKVITSVAVWNDAVGKRMSATYSVIDDETGKVVSDNNRFDRVVTDSVIKSKIDDLIDFATQALEG